MGKKRKLSGTARGILLLIVLLLAVLAVLFWKSARRDYSPLAGRLNDSISAILAKSGVGGGAEATSSEKESGLSVWKEYSRKIQLPESVDFKGLLRNIESQARQFHLTTVRSADREGKITVELRRGDRALSHLVFEVSKKNATPAPGKRFALVVDDIGGQRNLAPFIDLGIPVTFAIMPFERHSRDIAADLAGRNMPFILHLPLEPLAYPKIDPGKAALLVKMSDEQLRAKFAADLRSVPGAAGVSNHMGSRFSEDEHKMKLLLGMVKEKGLFYFDSYTTPRTRAPRAARAVQVPFRENELFVDLQDTPEFMRKQFDHILKRFGHTDEFVAIGHIQKKSLIPVLKEYIPKFRDAGIEFVYLTDLVNDTAK